MGFYRTASDRLTHDEKLLTCDGNGRASVYYVRGLDLPQPDDVFGPPENSSLSVHRVSHIGFVSPICFYRGYRKPKAVGAGAAEAKELRQKNC